MAKSFSWEWAFDDFSHEMSFVSRNMFGCRAAYLDGKLVMVLAEDAKRKEWYGVLLPTEREFHASLQAQFAGLVEHRILPKWLFLSANREDFEDEVARFGRLIARRDPRFGVIPKPKQRKSKVRAKKVKKVKKKIIGRRK